MESKAEQYYPTYTFKPENRDVLLIEFEEAQRIANSQTKVYGQVTNILLGVVTLLIPFFFYSDNAENPSLNLINKNALFFSVIIFLFGALVLRYFVDLQKQITINARKVVTLRTMLGLDYGHIHLTLPNWRVEGATNPFAIKYFNGWWRFQSMPFWVLTIGVNAIWWLATQDKQEYFIKINDCIEFSILWFSGSLIISGIYLLIFRHNLNDTNETSFLNIGKLLAKLFGFKLIDNFEYTIYRARLGVLEMKRLKVNYENLKTILINIEDQSFYKNKGVSFKSLVRGIMSQTIFFRKKLNLIESGGSTITMQLARTLFIPSNQNKYLRKLFEIWMSFWLQSKFTKQEILELYIVSVRYEYGVMGISNAIKHFFGSLNKKTLSPEECFFLVERLSNISGSYRKSRIEFLITKSGISLDKNKIFNIYHDLLIINKLKKDKDEFSKTN